MKPALDSFSHGGTLTAVLPEIKILEHFDCRKFYFGASQRQLLLFALMNIILRNLLLLLSTQWLCSCSLMMGKIVTTDANKSLTSDSTRTQIHNVLGKPLKYQAFTPPKSAETVVDWGGKTLLSGYDDFVVTGLVNTGDNTDGSTADGVAIYGALLVASGGLIEVLAIPVVAGNLIKDSREKFSLRIYYDTRDHYFCQEKKLLQKSN